MTHVKKIKKNYIWWEDQNTKTFLKLVKALNKIKLDYVFKSIFSNTNIKYS